VPEIESVRRSAPTPTPLRRSARPLAVAYDTALLDLDGVVYRGQDAVPHARAALAGAAADGMRLAFVTNNASRTPDAVAAHLNDLGVPAGPDDVVTSAQAAARLLTELVPAGAPVLVIGGDGLYAAVSERGLRPVRSADDEPAAVVQGYSPDLGWKDLAEACYALARGVPYVATNVDLTVPTARGIAPGNGTLVAAVRTASGVTPRVAGKPELPLHRETIVRTGAHRPLVVGDRLDTDIEGANRGGADSLLVLTGVTDATTLLAASVEHRPSYVSSDLRGLLESHPAPEPDSSGGYTCGGWTARVRDGALLLSADGTDGTDDGDGAARGRDDALRAACAAAWTQPSPPDTTDATKVLESIAAD
jgi:glycerol 3-phosphatase-2